MTKLSSCLLVSLLRSNFAIFAAAKNSLHFDGGLVLLASVLLAALLVFLTLFSPAKYLLDTSSCLLEFSLVPHITLRGAQHAISRPAVVALYCHYSNVVLVVLVPGMQRLRCQYLYLCTSKASKLSTWTIQAALTPPHAP